MKKCIISMLLAVVLVCTLAAVAQAALQVNSDGISLKDDGTGIELLDDFNSNEYKYDVQADTWTNTLTLTVDDANAIVYTNAGTGVVNKGDGLFTVNLAHRGSTAYLTIMTGGKTYNIKCSKKPVGPSAGITSFEYKKADNPSLLYDVVGIIDNDAQTITLDHPVPANVALKASFTHNGTDLRLNGITQISGESEQSFGNKHQLLYYLVANDGLDAVYSVVNPPLDLSGLIAQAEALSESSYTADSWATLQSALADAKAILQKGDATYGEVNDAYNALQMAIDGLVSKPVDKTALDELIAEAKEKNEGDYIAEGWVAFTEALEKAESVSADENATQAEVDGAAEELRAAMGALEPFIEVTSVKVDGAAIQQVRMRNTKQFSATVNPSDATDQSVTWESSNEKIFTVKDGLVTGLSTGSAKLIVTCGGKTSFIMVQVTA